MKIGFIGLGKMGSRMVFKLLKEGHEVVVWNRSPQPVEELRSQLNPKSEYRNSKQIQNTKYFLRKTNNCRNDRRACSAITISTYSVVYGDGWGSNESGFG